MHTRAPLGLALAAVLGSVGVLGAGCNDTAIVLRIASDRPQALDGICVELDAGGAQKFGQRYSLSSLPLPQTLTVTPGGKPATQALVYGFRDGVEVARTRRLLSFKSGNVVHVDLPLDSCQPHPVAPRFVAAAAPSGDPVDAAVLLPGTSVDGSDVALALATGVSARWSASAAGLMALGGTVPDAPAAPVPSLAAADLDGDCRLDVIVPGAAGAPPTAWHDAGDGSFSALGAVGSAPAVAAAAGDLDGDGTIDVVTVGGADAHLWLNDGAGHFHEQPDAFDAAPTDATAVAIGDLDGDGHADVVIGQGSAKAAVSRVYLNDKDGTGHFAFTAAALPPKPGRTSAVVLGDVDGDGDLDLVMAELGGAVRLYLNRGDAYLDDRSFTLLPDQVAADVPTLALGDLDGDCLPDLVVPRAGGAPLLWMSAGGGQFTAGPMLDQATEARGAAIDDVDGDGRPDLLLYGGMTGLQLEVQK